ncbi:uncharacterized protein V1516DRAFT_676700 [Lipomyces oligophaga]|uniref:uncharacterized protein n=1 Tax=Lipomyces oligophaga TaxID=45792 RepID=UPI0034CD1C98
MKRANKETTTSSRKHTSTTTTASKTSSSSSSSISIDPAAAAGGVSLITPATTDSTTYIKIGDAATFQWNYTSLTISPSKVNVEAYCSSNEYAYPIAMNLSIKDTTVVWNTSKYEATASRPLLTAMYTLYIYNSSGSVDDTAEAGYLQPFNSYYFGVYAAQEYTNLTEFECPTCSGAFSLFQKNILSGTVMCSILASILSMLVLI